MTRLSLGEKHQCRRCELPIPQGEVAILAEGHWLCDGCWSLWKILRGQTVAETFAAFVRSKKTAE
jgi:hypothetical protein